MMLLEALPVTFFFQAAGGKWLSKGSLVDSLPSGTRKEQKLDWAIAESVNYPPCSIRASVQFAEVMWGKKKARCGMCLLYQHCRDGDRRIPRAHQPDPPSPSPGERPCLKGSRQLLRKDRVGL